MEPFDSYDEFEVVKPAPIKKKKRGGRPKTKPVVIEELVETPAQPQVEEVTETPMEEIEALPAE